jgi:hypothetical protein
MSLFVRQLVPLATALTLIVLAQPLAAQVVPVPTDTVQLQIPPEERSQDTIPTRRVSADSTRPAPLIPAPARAGRPGWATATWEWDAASLTRFQGASLLELLNRVPGLVETRSNTFGQPAGLAAFGLGGGRVRVFRDGYEIDPLASATPDLQEIATADLAAVRVVRGLNETRIDLFTERLPDDRAHSMVEAGAGAPRTQLLRGLFSRPIGERVVATGAIDVVDADGFGHPSSFTRSGGVGRVSYLMRPGLGAEFEFRQESIGRTDRLEGVPPIPREEFTRRDLVLRARAEPLPGVRAEAFIARADRRTLEKDSTLFGDLRVNQTGVLAAVDRGMVWAEGAARFRNGGERGYLTPDLELDVEGGIRPMAGLAFSGHARSTSGDGVDGTEFSGTVRVGPFAGISAFATLAGGKRGIGTAAVDTLRIEPDTIRRDTLAFALAFGSITPELTASRLGAEWALGSIRAGAAYVKSDVNLVAPFGFSFDRFVPPAPTSSIDGVEAFVSAPIIFRQLRADGWITAWSDVGGRPYLPKQQWRGALEFHDIYYKGNLEPTIRLEARGRGSSIVPAPDSAAFNTVIPGYAMINAYVQIRIIDVEAFVLYENILNNQDARDLPLRTLAPRVLYGVRWRFKN